MNARIVLVAGLALTAAPPSKPTPRSLGAPVVEFNLDVTEIAGVRELADGRVLVSDPKEPGIYIVDPRTSSARKIGTRGSGPGEYLQPGGLYVARADSTYAMDRGQPRYLVIDPKGTIVATRLADAGSRRFVPGFGTDPRTVDAGGNVYMSRPIGTSPDGIDSNVVVRYTIGRATPDPVARLRAQETTRSTTAGLTMARETYYSPADGWGITPSGSVVVVRAAPYAVEWIDGSGRHTAGPKIEIDDIRITSAERDSIIGETSAPVTFNVRGADGANHPVTPPPIQPKFAPLKPAFEPSGVIAEPTERVWVRRTRPRGTSDVIYDVFDAKGVSVDRIVFPARSTVIGFGSRSVYVVQLDADDLPHLKKYRV